MEKLNIEAGISIVGKYRSVIFKNLILVSINDYKPFNKKITKLLDNLNDAEKSTLCKAAGQIRDGIDKKRSRCEFCILGQGKRKDDPCFSGIDILTAIDILNAKNHEELICCFLGYALRIENAIKELKTVKA